MSPPPTLRPPHPSPACPPQASEENSELAKEHLALTRTSKALYALRMAAERGMSRREALLRVMRSLVASERKVGRPMGQGFGGLNGVRVGVTIQRGVLGPAKVRTCRPVSCSWRRR